MGCVTPLCGVLRTDPIGRQRYRDGYHYYSARVDDMFNVSVAVHVEARWPCTRRWGRAVIGKEDTDGLVRPKAFTVLRSG